MCMVSMINGSHYPFVEGSVRRLRHVSCSGIMRLGLEWGGSVLRMGGGARMQNYPEGTGFYAEKRH